MAHHWGWSFGTGLGLIDCSGQPESSDCKHSPFSRLLYLSLLPSLLTWGREGVLSELWIGTVWGGIILGDLLRWPQKENKPLSFYGVRILGEGRVQRLGNVGGWGQHSGRKNLALELGFEPKPFGLAPVMLI